MRYIRENDNPMDRKVYIEVSIPIIVRVDEGVEISEVMDRMRFEGKLSKRFTKADLEDVGLFKWEVTDSK